MTKTTFMIMIQTSLIELKRLYYHKFLLTVFKLPLIKTFGKLRAHNQFQEVILTLLISYTLPESLLSFQQIQKSRKIRITSHILLSYQRTKKQQNVQIMIPSL